MTRGGRAPRSLLAGAVLAAGVLLVESSPVAADAMEGAGVVTGVVSFAGTGVPTGTSPCGPVSFTFSGTSQALLVTQGGPTEYAGSVGISGGGGSTCENASMSLGGTVSVTIVSYVSLINASSLRCTALSGGYLRVGTHVHVDTAGDCVVNGGSPIGVNFLSDGEFVPTTVEQGITQPVTSADFAAAVSLVQ